MATRYIRSTDMSSDSSAESASASPAYGSSTSYRDDSAMKQEQKYIRSIVIRDEYKPILQSGETRHITIKGNAGSVFTLVVKMGDSSECDECNILDNVNESIPDSGIYSTTVDFPQLDASATSETFTLEVTPAADVTLDRILEMPSESVIAEVVKENPDLDIEDYKKHFPMRIPNSYGNVKKLYQYKNPTVTLTNTTSQTSPALTVSGSDITKTGLASTYSNTIPGYSTSTYTLTITEDPSDTAGMLYVKPLSNFQDNIESDRVIKKRVKKDDPKDVSRTNGHVRLQPSGSYTDSDGVIIHEITQGSKVSGKVSYTKKVTKKIGITNCYIATDEYELENVNNIFEGMVVTGRKITEPFVTVEAVKSCGEITLSSQQVVMVDDVLTFSHEVNSYVSNVIKDVSPEGLAVIKLSSAEILPHDMELSFDSSNTIVRGDLNWSGSGSGSVTLTTEFSVEKFGKEDITQTLNLDNFITTTPNAHDQEVSVAKDSATSIQMIKYDRDYNASSKTGTVVRSPSNGTVGSYSTGNDTFRYSPHAGFIGLDSFTFTMSDGTNSSEEKTIYITVT